jgi:hypothetical protein
MERSGTGNLLGGGTDYFPDHFIPHMVPRPKVIRLRVTFIWNNNTSLFKNSHQVCKGTVQLKQHFNFSHVVYHITKK